MRFNTENAQVSIYCRKTGDQVSFPCGLELDWDDIRVLNAFFENTMRTNEGKILADYFEQFHDGVNYDRALIDSTDENDRLLKISHQLTVNGYDLFIDVIRYE